ncbi:hypothetical protein CROQUDRAFT_92075 [Cronartium quercuum f. sp. fusiforme G11]|uniref:HAT C-terminal dimerisation domain-containing protein n=1 Tax=Cronartium quercuum f. sp. fusiforme G11 TaxID=708437 RepID=A0A9P6TC32_9BASI|nr:hypothetical protein CROQUDRAFT_92075 [Cronartium quercuum f. sp. fusiforme G11]
MYASLGAPVAHITQDPNHSQVFDEVKSYLGGENPTQPGETMGAYWMRMITSNTYPVLGEIAIKLLANSASSACVERIFSISRGIATSARPRLSPQTISRLICVRYWTENKKATSNDSGLYEGVESTTLWKYNYSRESCLRLRLYAESLSACLSATTVDALSFGPLDLL